MDTASIVIALIGFVASVAAFVVGERAIRQPRRELVGFPRRANKHPRRMSPETPVAAPRRAANEPADVRARRAAGGSGNDWRRLVHAGS